jgi:hypothetical protein
MADIVRANNPTAPLYLLEAGTTKVGAINGILLRQALDWVVANAAKHNIKSVSFSYNSGNGQKCIPLSPGVKVDITHGAIVTAIATLKANGVKFYAAAGNHGSSKQMLDYPACIADAIAVGSPLYQGSQSLSDIVIGGLPYQSTRLKSQVTSLQDSSAISLDGPNFLKVGNTTSVTTAIAAATFR